MALEDRAADVLGVRALTRSLLCSTGGGVSAPLKADVATKTAELFQRLPLAEAARVVTVEQEYLQVELLQRTIASYRRDGLVIYRAMIRSIPSVEPCSRLFGSFGTCATQLSCDADPLVRFYALEVLHDLVRRMTGPALQSCFFQILHAVACVVADQDTRVSAAAREVSNAMREVVIRNEGLSLDVVGFYQFAIYTLTPFEYADAADSPLLVWMLEWIEQVLDTPGVDIAPALFPSLVRVLLRLSTRASVWPRILSGLRSCKTESLAACRSQLVEPATMVKLLVNYMEEVDGQPEVRALCLGWLESVLRVHPANISHMYGDVVASVRCVLLHLDSNEDRETRESARALHNWLLSWQPVSDDPRAVTELVPSVLAFLRSRRGSTNAHLAVLEWLRELASPISSGSSLDAVVHEVVHLLANNRSPRVIATTTRVLYRLCVMQLDLLLTQLFEAWSSPNDDPPMQQLEVVITLLQAEVIAGGGADGGTLLSHVAIALPRLPDKRFVTKGVLMISSLLLTSHTFAPTRAILRRGVGADQRAAELFESLCPCWSYNSVAVISLALLARCYDLSLRVVEYLATVELGPTHLVLLDRLMELLESSVYGHVRVELIHPSRCLSLVQTLYALLLLTPLHSPHHTSLQTRLHCIPQIAQLEQYTATTKSLAQDDGPCPAIDVERLFRVVEMTTAELNRFEMPADALPS